MLRISKYIYIFLLVFALSVFKSDAVLAGEGLTESCVRISLFNDQTAANLSAQCLDGKGNGEGHLVDNKIPLNSYITNNGGNLAWQKDGGFSGSVKNCRLEGQETTILRCDARKGDGSYVDTSITLDEGITNENGTLTMDDALTAVDVKAVLIGTGLLRSDV